VKVILIGSDFTGAEKLIGTALPKRTKIVDLTTELSQEILPAKPDPLRIGAGLPAARALAAVAPDCDLVLVRIDPGSFFHLTTVVQLLRSEVQYTDALQLRLNEIAIQSEVLEREKRDAIANYRTAFSDLSDDVVAVKRRQTAKAALDAVLEKDKKLTVVVNRFNTYQKETVAALAGGRVIVNTLAWDSGYPMDALSAFSQAIDQLSAVLPPQIRKRPGDPDFAPKPPLIGIQAASNAGASVWGGPFLDANRDGLMEFVPHGTKLPADNWTPHLNFLGTRAANGTVSPELAAGAKLRFVVQWREPADPNFPESITPIYPLVLRLKRQIDSTGAKRSNDEMVEEARSGSLPTVIFRTKTYLVFEQMLEYTVPAAGRYALAIEAEAGSEPLLPALKRDVEIYPRVVLETMGTSTADPRAVFRSFTTPDAGVGVSGDALGAITIGTDAPGALIGGGTGLTLRKKPDYFGPDAVTIGPDSFRGPGMATGFAGGMAAALLQARTGAPNVFLSTGLEQGKKLEVPAAWLKVLQPAEKGKP
jgi:hypothetical protein